MLWVNQFYEYSRLCAGDFEIEMEKTDLSRVLRESLWETAGSWRKHI